MTGLFGRRRIDVANAPQGWYVKAIRYGSTDISNDAVELKDAVTGTYAFGPVRDGDYIVVAVPAGTPIPGPGEWNRAAALAALGERVTVADPDHRTVELRVVQVR